jgi:hypothetical protein
MGILRTEEIYTDIIRPKSGQYLTIEGLARLGSDVLDPRQYGTSGTLGALQAAISDIGSDPATLYLAPDTWNITDDLEIPDNINLYVENGAIFYISATKTLTINGPIDAGPYQIFSWAVGGLIDISGSPTSIVYPEWWGAIAETSIWAQDNTAVFTKMTASISGQRQIVKFSGGWYRIASALAVGGNGARWQGSGIFQSGIWIDIGGTGTGVTFGISGSVTEAVELSDLSFLGPANCCAYGVDFLGNNPHVKRVNFYMGATAYACRTRSTEVYEMNPIYMMPNSGHPALSVCPAGAFAADVEPVLGWANNTANININTLGDFTIPCVYFNGTGTNITLSGTIQGTTPAAAPDTLVLNDCQTMRIVDLYTEGFSGDINITNCTSGLTIDNILFFNNTNINLINCVGVHLGPSWIFGTLYINAGCRGITIDSLNCGTIIDDAPDTNWSGVRKYSYDYGSQKGRDKVNFWYNTSLNRFTATKPDGIDNENQVTWTKCGIGLGDTTQHLAPFCTKIVTNGGAGFFDRTLDALQLNRVQGQTTTASYWLNFPTGQTLDDGVSVSYARPFNWSITLTVPEWTGTTEYKVNDAVYPTAAWLAAHPAYTNNGVNDNIWVCIVAGTSDGTEPIWGTGAVSAESGTTVTDGTITWVVKPKNVDIWHSNCYRATMQGNWHQDSLTIFVPNNATVVYFRYDMARQGNGSDEATCYFAEPSLVVSNQTPTALVESVGEFQSYIQVGANKIYLGQSLIPTNASSPLYTSWAQRGDVAYGLPAAGSASPGWVCITSGLNNSGAVWKAMGNLAA